jgi:hypothetical protein
MEVYQWVIQHWLDLLQSVGIIGGLVFTAHSLRINSKVRRVSNLLTITEHHRAIWTPLFERPELARVIDPTADVRKRPVTNAEELFVLLAVLHLGGAHEAAKEGLVAAPDGLQKDFRRFFSWPIPKEVWKRIKPFQDAELFRLIESCLDEK